MVVGTRRNSLLQQGEETLIDRSVHALDTKLDEGSSSLTEVGLWLVKVFEDMETDDVGLNLCASLWTLDASM